MVELGEFDDSGDGSTRCLEEQVAAQFPLVFASRKQRSMSYWHTSGTAGGGTPPDLTPQPL